LSQLPPSQLEHDEGLEQLRALQAGWTIVVTLSDYRSLSVDTPADLDRVQRSMKSHSDATTEVG
jgi:3-deoxy-manno-octulosonate cytidylyltransferase (CMP-KDO synthetase)